MSTYWDFHCKTCDRQTIDFDGLNHGQHILRSIWRLREHINAIYEQDKSGYLEVHIMAYGVGDLWSFLSEHKDHEVELLDEYGGTEPIEEVSDE